MISVASGPQKSETASTSDDGEEEQRERTVVRHSQDRDLRDGPVPAFDPSRALVYGRQIRVHVTRVSTPPGHLLSCGRDLAEGVGVRRHVRQDDEDVLLELVRKVLGRRQRETGRNDTLDPARFSSVNLLPTYPFERGGLTSGRWPS